MKYTNITHKMGRVLEIIASLITISIMLLYSGGLLYAEIIEQYGAILSMVWLCVIPINIFIINYMLGHICGDKFYDTGIVYEGNSMIDVVKTSKYYKRRMVMCWIGCSLYFILFVRFAFSIISETTVSIIGMVLSIIGIVIYYIFARSSLELSKKHTEIEIQIPDNF